MAMGKGIGGMAGGKMAGKMRTVADFKAKAKSIREGFKPGGNIDMAVKASRAAKTAAPAAGLGMMSNGPAAKAAAPAAGMGIKAKSKTIMDAYKTGGTKAAGKAMRAVAKKPFGTL